MTFSESCLRMAILKVVSAVLLLQHAAVIPAADTGSRPSPNIVFVLFDDMGWGQPECYNANSALRTPNFNKLCQQGMQFTDAHSASAVCTPTRYGLLTGRYPARIGQFGVLTTYSSPIIPQNRLTVASLLKQHGYATACVGKWHLGMNWVDGKPGKESEVPIGARMTGGPNDLGFDYFCGFTHARNIGTIIEQDTVVSHVSADENQPLMINKAVQWIELQTSDAPFFLYFPMCPPHTPVAPSQDYLGQSGARNLVQNDPQYGDWVYQGDAMLGQIVETLNRKGLIDNTLIIATSDNGAEHRAYEPLRESKRSIYEGGHRVPFVASWPGKIKPNTVNSHTICLNDLMATAAEIVGSELPDNAAEDSFSLLPLLLERPTTSTPRDTTIHQSHKGDLAVRQGSWKMVFLKTGQRELYNIENDLSEKLNCIETHRDQAKKLANVIHSIIEDGRSTTGVKQPNEFALSIPATDTKSAHGARKSAGRNSDQNKKRQDQ